MSGIRLTEVDDATIATPPSGKATLFLDDTIGPAYKDDTGTVTALEGTPGADGVLTYHDHGNTGATETVDASVADVHRLVANAATVTLTLSGAPASGTPGIIRLWLEQDGSGGRDWVFPGSVDWGDPGEPTWTDRSAGEIDLVDLMTVDGGTVWVATVAGRAAAGSSDLDAIIAASSGQDIADALAGAAAPDAGNVFATMADVGVGGAGTLASGRVVRTTGDVTLTGTTAFTDITGMSITISTGARKVLLSFTSSAYINSAAGAVGFDFVVDGTRVTTGSFGMQLFLQHATADEAYPISIHYLTDALSAASHTFKVQWRINNGSFTAGLNADSASAATVFTAVELYA